jgi:hypothetical protein
VEYMLRLEDLGPIRAPEVFEPDELVIVVNAETWIADLGDIPNHRGQELRLNSLPS